MKRIILFLLMVFVVLVTPVFTYAAEGGSGYEGGISGQILSSTKTSSVYKYQEVVFITGRPVILNGTLTIKKKISKSTEADTYNYSLSDANKNTLNRAVTLSTQITNNGDEITKATSISGKYSEIIVINGKTYTLSNYSLTKSSVVDTKPGVSYFAGNIYAVKTYTVSDSPNVIITLKLNDNNNKMNQFSGYDQNWSSGEVQVNNYDIRYEGTSSNGPVIWNGNAKVKLSSTSTTDLKYVQNYPDEISFGGDYIKSQSAVGKLTYETNMPEFDKDGLPTDRIVTKKGSFQLNTFPTQESLVAQDLSAIRGHWAVDDINKLYSLKIYDDDPSIFIPDQYMSRAEFAKALSKAANIIDISTTKKTKSKIVSPYEDVPVNDPYFTYIQQLTLKKVLSGFSDGNFHPYDTITRAQAVEAFIKVLGLEEVAKDKYPVTIFKDNDDIPTWSLRSIAAAYKIGIIKGDGGYFRPNQNITKAEAAALLNRLIDYMRKDMAKSYSDKILNY